MTVSRRMRQRVMNNRILSLLIAGLLATIPRPVFADGWTVGGIGVVLKSTDSGSTWSLSTPVNVLLNSVYFVNDTTGWAVGGGVIMKTTNGGSTWTTDFATTGAVLNSVFFLDTSTGWAVGTTGTILKTTNGGSSWSLLSSPTGATLTSVYFVNSSTGWAVGGGGVVLKTTTGGSSWTATNPTGAALNSVFFVDTLNGWAVGNVGTILKTTNGGSSWSLSTPVNVTLNSVTFIDASTGWIAGGGVILRTTNGGTAWTSDFTTTGAALTSVFFISATTGWTVGSSGTILRSTNGGVSWTQSLQQLTTATLSSVFFTKARATVRTVPSGPSFSADGGTYSSTQTFTWVSGSPHSIGTTSPQNGPPGTRFIWSNWSNGGAISQTVSPRADTTFTANFMTQYFLTMSSQTGGTASPPSGYQNASATVPLSATPSSGYLFASWTGNGTGSFTGTTNPVSVTMNGPIGETAGFCLVSPATTWYRDADGDGLGNSTISILACTQPAGYVNRSGDCNDADAAVWAIPGAVDNLAGALDSSESLFISWTSLDPIDGSGTNYDIARGSLSTLHSSGFPGGGVCVGNNLSDTPYTEGPLACGLTPGDGCWYLVRAQNVCGTGTYGPAAFDSIATCP